MPASRNGERSYVWQPHLPDVVDVEPLPRRSQKDLGHSSRPANLISVAAPTVFSQPSTAMAVRGGCGLCDSGRAQGAAYAAGAMADDVGVVHGRGDAVAEELLDGADVVAALEAFTSSAPIAEEWRFP